MDRLDWNNLLIISGLVLIVVEVALGAATGFDLLLIGVIFIVSGGLGILLHSTTYSLVSIAALSFLYLLIGRKFIKKALTIETKSTNVDNVLHRKGLVTKEITAKKAGQVKIEGEIWRANSDKTIDVGKEIVVESVSGVTLKVK
ncbi:hypothetical protein A3C28_03570 [Candidatus Roizmanbacteria bacterium RIFCSPHIGHO2_02_FULL_39_9]|uniref:NfeD-like C-terminal domain-containing protein n=1 Tax=Candidatus Roizmanbacteria bacterium RIFCSPHIGHO2_02_FULL_39_9 TaxID=1802040 RepID=A0A1F7H564_9BACT|nr:MAG: hypothetical protein A3C28_03570 [Candidatus Roizmanbacteria bacterium RIFCSPHIGHO2_02_FULL_39_9]